MTVGGAVPFPRTVAPFFFLRHEDVASLSLSAGGGEVPAVIDAADPAQVGFWLRPLAPLAAGTTHRVSLRLRDGTVQEVDFTTDDRLDTTPPVLESANLRNGMEALCDRHIGATLSVVGDVESLVRLDIGGETYWFVNYPPMDFGHVLERDHCSGPTTGWEAPGTWTGTVEIYDSSGLASPSREVTVTLAPLGGVEFPSCAAAGVWPWLGLWARRRRRALRYAPLA